MDSPMQQSHGIKACDREHQFINTLEKVTD